MYSLGDSLRQRCVCCGGPALIRERPCEPAHSEGFFLVVHPEGDGRYDDKRDAATCRGRLADEANGMYELEDHALPFTRGQRNHQRRSRRCGKRRTYSGALAETAVADSPDGSKKWVAGTILSAEGAPYYLACGDIVDAE
ncbi:hypothetical protein AQ860_11355 [Burkholderia pseudomallei]|nr:hypothetical protein WJ04_06035 [Burkholderia vietnamiensis]KVR83765.1 hypothetical protein WK27_20465 [Burkholderia vietnamiensis]OMT54658.1 hypothetical protein AQ760_17565 [Burkholderia pseudomallei]OMZ16424.1 hypothetical protein AQ859_13095 [Burkholderia pseudomallei]OMZ37313.1 hypothetical protein AQ860_11355 [Burkholderia pseudomallei]